jgi:hypothetical protein
VTIDGVEAGIQYNFDSCRLLEGFGVLANYTYQKDKGFTQTNCIDGSPLTFPASRATATTPRCTTRTSASARAPRTTGATSG